MQNFWRFLAFWFDVVLRTLALAPQAFKRLDLIYGGVPIVLGAGAAWYFDLIPWWMIFIVLLAFGLMWTVYEKWKESDDKKEELEKMLATAEKRIILKTLLGEAIDEGRILQRMLRREEPDEVKRARLIEVELWEHHTSELIEVAFDKFEAQLFLKDRREPTGIRRRSPVAHVSEIEKRLKRLYELSSRIDTIPMRPGFDPATWTRDER